jgi:hypothetical protein
MARYNSATPVNAYNTSGGTLTLNTPLQGAFTELTGTSAITVNLPNPALYTGTSQVFYNASTQTATLSTVANGGSIAGPGLTTGTSQSLTANATATLFSDGTNWVQVQLGGPVLATTLSASSTVSLSPSGASVSLNPSAANVTISPTSGGTVTISPNGTLSCVPSGAITLTSGSAGSITNMSIGSSNPLSGAFTTLSSSSTTSFTLGTDATAYNSGGTLTVTGGVGISGKVFTNGNISSSGTLALSSTSATHTISSTTNSGGTGSGALVISGGLGVANTIYCATFFETSSIKLKENIKPITNALQSVLKLKGVTYDRKDGTSINESGLIAEHVYKVLPSVVGLDEKGKPNAIQYSKLSAYLIECIKDLQSEIDELKGAKKSNVPKVKVSSIEKPSTKTTIVKKGKK